MGHVIKSSASTTQFRKMGIIFQEAPFKDLPCYFHPPPLFALVVFPLLSHLLSCINPGTIYRSDQIIPKIFITKTLIGIYVQF